MGVNYTRTLIAVADDCPATEGTVPPRNDAKPSIAAEHYRLLTERPYELTSEDLMFQVHADKQGIPDEERTAAREDYFAKPRACLRASPLPKKFGWGLLNDEEGRLALVGMETDSYRTLLETDSGIAVVKAMRSSRKS